MITNTTASPINRSPECSTDQVLS